MPSTDAPAVFVWGLFRFTARGPELVETFPTEGRANVALAARRAVTGGDDFIVMLCPAPIPVAVTVRTKAPPRRDPSLTSRRRRLPQHVRSGLAGICSPRGGGKAHDVSGRYWG